VGRGAGVGRAGGAGAAAAGAALRDRFSEYSSQIAQKMIRIMIVPPSSGPNGKLSTGVAVIAPGSGEITRATLSGLEAIAVGPLEPEADGLGAGAVLAEGLGAAAVGAGLGTTATGLAVGAGAGLNSTAIGEGDGGATAGSTDGTNDSELPAPSMCD
jgi:hypothetical protein